MFTGIVTATGRIERIYRRPDGLNLVIAPLHGRIDLESCQAGDSVAVAGVCLTMLDPDANGFHADVSAETLANTTIGERKTGDMVNLELALQVGDRLGGHLTSGHVDAPVTLLSRRQDGDSERFEFDLPRNLQQYVARKGSACLDGVSLTVNSITEDRFCVCIIPHTLSVTTLGELAPGERANLEVDMISRYLERLIKSESA